MDSTLIIVLILAFAIFFCTVKANPLTGVPSCGRLTLEQRLRADRRVSRLLRNSKWAPAAEAALNFFLRVQDCPVSSWRRSSTWAQVEYAYRELAAREIG